MNRRVVTPSTPLNGRPVPISTHSYTHTHTHTHWGWVTSFRLICLPFLSSIRYVVWFHVHPEFAFLFFFGLSVSADRFFFFFFFFFFKKSRFYLVLPSLVGFLFELIKNRLFFFFKFSLIVDFEWTVDWFEQVLPSFAEIDFEPVFASSFRGWMKKKTRTGWFYLVLPSFIAVHRVLLVSF